ncbi:hypothetical protein KCV06_g9, partial [Aureobasidium melanogenum]
MEEFACSSKPKESVPTELSDISQALDGGLLQLLNLFLCQAARNDTALSAQGLLVLAILALSARGGLANVVLLLDARASRRGVLLVRLAREPRVGSSFMALENTSGRSKAPGGMRFLLGLPWGVWTGEMKGCALWFWFWCRGEVGVRGRSPRSLPARECIGGGIMGMFKCRLLSGDAMLFLYKSVSKRWSDLSTVAASTSSASTHKQTLHQTPAHHANFSTSQLYFPSMGMLWEMTGLPASAISFSVDSYMNPARLPQSLTSSCNGLRLDTLEILDNAFPQLLENASLLRDSRTLQIKIFRCTYVVGSLKTVSTSTCRAEVVREQRNTNGGGLSIVRVKIGEVGKVDGRAVVDGLEGTASVEVTHCLDLVLLLSTGTLAGVDGSSKSTRMSQIIGRQTAHELQFHQSCEARYKNLGEAYIVHRARVVQLASLTLGSQACNVTRKVRHRTLSTMGSCIKASTNDTPLASPAACCICE